MSAALAATEREPLSRAGERSYVEALIRRIVAECPRRKSAGPQERRAQDILRDELKAQGLQTEYFSFRFHNNLYAVLALHFGVATAGSIAYFVSPWIGLVLHLLAAVSYLGESSYRFFLLRRLLPRYGSQNLVATLPAQRPVRQRIVLIGHADAAPTGWIFRPNLVKAATNNYYPRPYRFLRKQMVGAVLAMIALAGLDLLAALPTGRSMPILFYGLTFACAFPLLLNLQVVFRNAIVPGASDNLTGCAALPVLAHRFAEKKPADVEMVFVATGCEEAGCGGSLALARAMQDRWDKRKTVVIAVDILCNGRLRYKQCGEIIPLPIAPWLFDTLQDVAAGDDRWGELKGFDAPAGSDDLAPFLAHGYQGVCLCCVDPELGVTRHYHLPSDTPDNVEYDDLMNSIDFSEMFIDAVIRRRQEEAQALAQGHTLPPPIGEPPFRPLPKPLWSWHTWLWLAPLSGLYCGATFGWTWDTVFVTFRNVWLVFVLTFPLFLLLQRFGRNPDRSLIAKVYVFFLLTALATSFVNLFVHPIALGLISAWEAASPIWRGASLGAAFGAAFGISLALWIRSGMLSGSDRST
jgi:hypothetical protein